MSVARILALVVAGLAAIVGISTAIGSLREPSTAETAAERFVLAVHDAAKAGFWFALAVLFAGVGLLADPYTYRWFVMLPIGMAALRLASAAFLALR